VARPGLASAPLLGASEQLYRLLQRQQQLLAELQPLLDEAADLGRSYSVQLQGKNPVPGLCSSYLH
jgi:hypothetical protein